MYVEVAIVFEGSSKHQIGNCVYEVQAGDVYILKGDVKHCYLEPRNLLVGNVMFDISKLDFPEIDFREIPCYRAFFELEPNFFIKPFEVYPLGCKMLVIYLNKPDKV